MTPTTKPTSPTPTATSAHPSLYTIGHSNRSWNDFLHLLQAHGIRAVADIRRLPGSRRLPQFDADNMADALAANGIDYVACKELGGRRKPSPDSPNLGWHHPAFRAYADYMATPEFQSALENLLASAKARPTAIMCAEAVPWRCHRNLVADAAVLLYGWEVRHIMTEKNASVHKPAPFARVENDYIIYPADDLIGNC